MDNVALKKKWQWEIRVDHTRGLFVERLLIIRRITRRVPIRPIELDHPISNSRTITGLSNVSPDFSPASSSNQDLFTHISDVSVHCTSDASSTSTTSGMYRESCSRFPLAYSYSSRSVVYMSLITTDDLATINIILDKKHENQRWVWLR